MVDGFLAVVAVPEPLRPVRAVVGSHAGRRVEGSEPAAAYLDALDAELLPTGSEGKRTSGRSGSFSVLIKGLGLGRSSTRGAEDTDDTNVLLGRVLRPRRQEGASPRHGSHPRARPGATCEPDYDKFGEELSGRLGREVPLQRVADSLRHRWSQLATGTLVPVEGPWDIKQTDDGLLLKLAAVTVNEGEDSPERSVEMPRG